MKYAIALVVLTFTMSLWTVAQQPDTSGGQPASPSSRTPGASQTQPSVPQTPGAGQTQPSVPGAGNQDSPQMPGDASQVGNPSMIEGCLGGTSPNFTITDKAGTTYKLNFPPGANTSALESHIGESVRAIGPVK